jgi:endonuclease/exonuclease/phosphatase family metal-dependent hydrolase
LTARWRDLRWRLAAPAATALLLVEVLRIWLPSISFGAEQVLGIRPAAGAAAGLALLAVPAVLMASGRVAPVLGVRVGGAALVLGRLGLLVDVGYPWRVVTASVAVLGGVLALASLAGAGAGRTGRTGVLFGAVLAGWLQLGLGTLDLTWRDGPGALVGGLVLAIGTGLVLLVARLPDEPDPADAAWPWLVLGPILVLLLLVVMTSGRVAVAVGPAWDPRAVAAVTAAAGGLAVVSALLAPLGPPRAVAPVGGLLMVLGTAAALPAASVASVVAQLVLAVGVGLSVGGTSGSSSAGTHTRRAVAAGGGWWLVGGLAVGYYADTDLQLTAGADGLLLVTAIGLAAVGMVARRRVLPRTAEPLHPGLGALRMTTLTLIGALGVAIAVTPAAAPRLELGAPDAPIRLVLLNVNHGWGPDGRFDPVGTAEALRSLDPDVIVLTEVDRGWLIGGGHDLLAILAGELGFDHRFAPAVDEVAGTALLTHFAITESLTEQLPQGADRVRRSQLAAVLAVAEGERLGIVATQLSTVDDQGATRLPQARAVAAMAARMRERGVPVSILGDLRVPFGSPELEAFGASVVSALPEGSATHPSDAPQDLPDHVLVSTDLEVIEVAIPDIRVSDHRPVTVTIVPASPSTSALSRDGR